MTRATSASLVRGVAAATWLRLLLPGTRLAYQDWWKDSPGGKLLLTPELLRSGHPHDKLLHRSSDAAIGERVRRQGIGAHGGPWEKLPIEKFGGFFVDLASGASRSQCAQLRALDERAALACVMCWTLTEEADDSVELLLQGIYLADQLRGMKWQPALKNMSNSMFYHRSNGLGAIMQIWRKGVI